MERFAPATTSHRRWILAVILAVDAVLLFFAWLLMGPAGVAAALMVGGALALRTWLATPTAYLLSDDRLVVERRALPSRAFRRQGPVERLPNRRALRVRGAGWAIGGSGIAVQHRLTGGRVGVNEHYRVFDLSTSVTNLVRVSVRGGTVVVSPADPTRFVAAGRRFQSALTDQRVL